MRDRDRQRPDFGGWYTLGRTEIVGPSASYAVMFRGARAKIKKRKNSVWKLPRVWKHRTLPHPLGNHRTVSTSFHTPHLLLCLWIRGGQF